jgi:hypothetical protein
VVWFLSRFFRFLSKTKAYIVILCFTSILIPLGRTWSPHRRPVQGIKSNFVVSTKVYKRLNVYPESLKWGRRGELFKTLEGHNLAG